MRVVLIVLLNCFSAFGVSNGLADLGRLRVACGHYIARVQKDTANVPSATSPVPSLVEMATLEWGGENRKTGGRQTGLGENGAMQGHAGVPTPASGGGGEKGMGGERRSFLRHALPSKPPAGSAPHPHPGPSHAPSDTALRSQTAWEPGTCWQQRDTEQNLPGNW